MLQPGLRGKMAAVHRSRESALQAQWEARPDQEVSAAEPCMEKLFPLLLKVSVGADSGAGPGAPRGTTGPGCV